MSEFGQTAKKEIVADNIISANDSLSQQLSYFATQLGEREVKFRELVQITRGRGYDLLLVVLALPFLTPIPLPGLSTPFGLTIAFAGMRMGFGKKMWYPEKLLEKKLPRSFFPNLLKFTITICKIIEFFARPRFQFIHKAVMFQRLAGIMILFCGLFLSLPLPIPFSNTIPAITVVLLASSAMRKDGIIFLIACLLFIINLIFFSGLLFGSMEIIEYLKQKQQ